ncbi:MAG: TonB family protein [Chthoniobacterales bacterium]
MRRVFAVLLFAVVWANHAQGAEEKQKFLKLAARNIRAIVVSGVEPEYPYEARANHIIGSGVASIRIDRATGTVASCEMAPSTGSLLLDEAALQAFRLWRFKPGTVSGVLIPITFTMTGRGGQVIPTYRVKEKPADEALAPYLGKGAVDSGPMPVYPHSLPWTDRQGQGLYEIRVGKDGRVSDVKTLHPSGDVVFDRIVFLTLREWRFRRGPLIVDLPLAFSLTPTHYSVFIPKGR